MTITSCSSLALALLACSFPGLTQVVSTNDGLEGVSGPNGSATPPQSRAPDGRWGFDLAGMNTGVRPGDNFYLYTNGRYLDKLIIPPERSVYTAGSALTDTALNRVRELLQKTSEASTSAKLAADYFASVMNEERIDELGVLPMQRELKRIRAAHVRTSVVSLMGQEHAGFYRSIFAIDISPDLRHPTQYAVQIGQPDLGLLDRSYYLNAELASERQKYRLYIAKLLTLAKWPNPEKSATEILGFETAMAEASWSGEQRRDPERTYNPASTQQLEATAPEFPWKVFLRSAGIGHEHRFVIAEKSAVIKIAALYAKTPPETLQAWEAFGVLDQAAPYLSRSYRNAAFEFHDKVLSGRSKPLERWKQAVRLVGSGNGMSHMEGKSNLGDIVAQLYVERYFQAGAREQVAVIVANVKAALRTRLESLSWMEPRTKAEALEKLRKYTVELGYPDHWRNYSGLRIDSADLIGNIRRTAALNWDFEVNRLHAPVDQREWPVEPHVVNAYNDGAMHLIVFTAAVLNPPVYDPLADPAVNYGAIGAIVGHELTHGFDDQGRHFDSNGRMRDWWGAGDTKLFLDKAAQLGDQFDHCEAMPGMNVNGKLTMGENLADLGGLVLSLDAYHASLHGNTAPVLDGLTGDQRFFLSYAQQRRGKYTKQALREQVLTDPHSPDECRVNIEVRNLDAWYPIFHVVEGERFYLAPAKRVSLW